MNGSIEEIHCLACSDLVDKKQENPWLRHNMKVGEKGDD
jgi:hypothetical protein